MKKKTQKRMIAARWAPGWSAPQGAFDKAPHEESANPAGNRAERRRAKRLGIKPLPPEETP